jgi:hypothetical protein
MGDFPDSLYYSVPYLRFLQSSAPHHPNAKIVGANFSLGNAVLREKTGPGILVAAGRKLRQ